MSQEKEVVIRLYKTHYHSLYNFFLKRLGSHEDAADAVQEAFKRLIGSNGTGKMKSPEAYLFQIAKNLVVDMLRSKSIHAKYIESVEIEEQLSTIPLPDVALDTQKRKKLVQKALSELPSRCREVFILHRFDNLTYSQIAKRLNISTRTVENHIAKALFYLRKHLAALK